MPVQKSDSAALLREPTADTRERVKATVPDEVDVAIIGAGLGGLTSGAYLARAGLKVAVFDSHYVAGGCATMFSRGTAERRYHFDIGLHYIGDCGPEGQIPRMLRGLDIDLQFEEMDPDGFDTIVLPGLEFRIPASVARYRERLVEHFPSERRGIDRYVRLLGELEAFQALISRRKKPGALGFLGHVALKGRLLVRYQHATIGQFLDSCTDDPLLRGVLLGQNGDYGLPPSKASCMLHMGLALHYFRGAYYPRGGGQVIADRLAETIESTGGSVLLRRPVEQVLVEDGRAVGVRVQGQRQDPKEVRAKLVISNADIKRTMEQLVPGEALPEEWRARSERFEMGGAIFLCCLGVRATPEQLGGRATNHWVFDTTDIEEVYAAIDRGDRTPRGVYITSASMKDPHTPNHAPPGELSVEVMALSPGRPEHWGVDPHEVFGPKYRKGEVYQQRKQEVEDALVARFCEFFGLSEDAITYRESATPVTHTRFTRATDGTGYGLAVTPEQFLKNRPGTTGPLPGLYLAGASTRSGHGIVGAMTSGIRASQRISKELGLGIEDPLLRD